MIGLMVRPGSHTVGPDAGTISVLTYREGIAQKVGHDLVIDVGNWQATVQAAQDGTLSSIELEVDANSLQVREGHHGVKPLTDRDRDEIRKNVAEKVLRGQPIGFRSAALQNDGGTLTGNGELSVGSAGRPISFELASRSDGRLTGSLPLTQSEWGIKPYRGLMGALKVRDAVEIVIDVQLPADP